MEWKLRYMACLKHMPEKYKVMFAKRYGHDDNNWHWAENHYRHQMTRIYERSKEGKRGFVPFGFYCSKCNKVYSDQYLEQLFDKKHSEFLKNFDHGAT